MPLSLFGARRLSGCVLCAVCGFASMAGCSSSISSGALAPTTGGTGESGGGTVKESGGGATTGGSTGSTSNTGGSTSNTGGSTSNTGGSTSNNTGGSTGNTGGSTGSTGGGAPNAGGKGQGGEPAGGQAAAFGPRLIGRFDVTNPAAPVFAWSGSAISVRFKALAVSVDLVDGGNNVFEVILDGVHTVMPTVQGSHRYALGSGLSNDAHELLLYRRTEAFQGDTTFKGFDLPASAYLPPTAAPARRLEVIGDSISAGYGDEGTFPCTFGPATENHYLSYEAVAARNVGAELHTEAWSGIGVLRNYNGDTANPRMPDRFPLAVPDQSQSSWDFAAFVPQAVVINLGTNDFSGGDPGSAFQSAYLAFVVSLRGHYPDARFFLAVGPMLSGPQYSAALGYLNGVIAARAANSDKNLSLLEFGSQDAAKDGLGCDYHPSLATHQKMAAILVAALGTDLGW